MNRGTDTELVELTKNLMIIAKLEVSKEKPCMFEIDSRNNCVAVVDIELC